MTNQSIRNEIEDIIVDCYNEEEEATAWEIAFQDGVNLPFDVYFLGMDRCGFFG